MDILKLFQEVKSGLLSPEEASEQLAFSPVQELMDGVTLDMHRALRTGQGECVLAGSKTPARLLAAVRGLSGADGKTPVLSTRVTPEQGKLLTEEFSALSGKIACGQSKAASDPNKEGPESARGSGESIPGPEIVVEYYPDCGIFSLNRALNLTPPWPRAGDIMIVTAGSSDMPVALEAFATARFYGASVGMAADLGVAGLHRITPWLDAFYKAKVIIVIAGMEGALPSVIAGLTAKPVLAVPTSIGYGVSAGGFVALAGMLSACAPGISVFNIDNGYGAAVFACRLLTSFNQAAK